MVEELRFVVFRVEVLVVSEVVLKVDVATVSVVRGSVDTDPSLVKVLSVVSDVGHSVENAVPVGVFVCALRCSVGVDPSIVVVSGWSDGGHSVEGIPLVVLVSLKDCVSYASVEVGILVSPPIVDVSV